MAAVKRARVGKVVRIALERATLGDVWDRLADAYGARTALTLEEPLRLYADEARELSYTEIATLVAAIAGALADAGVEPGCRVAVCMGNRIEYALVCFAAVRAGAVAVPLHHHLKKAEVSSLVERSGAAYLVADPAVAVERKGVVVLTGGPGGSLASGLVGATPLKQVPVDVDAPAMILFTSGTTGAPKGAVLTSRSLLAVARLAALVPDARNERGVCGLPLAHVMGMSTLLCALLAGARMHWLTKFDAKIALERIVSTGATFFIGVPAMYALLADADPERHDLSSVRLWASGADAMPPALVERFRKLGCSLRSPASKTKLLTSAFAEIYGMVEVSGPAILKLTPPTPFADGPLSGPARRALARPRVARAAAAAKSLRHALAGGRVGDDGQGAAFAIPIPPYRVRIVDDDGKPVKAGVVGELVIRGPGVTKGFFDATTGPTALRGGVASEKPKKEGYAADPAATSKSTKDGWLRTGDLAWKNRVGLIAFATRKKDVVKHGGYSVFPAEVEAQLTANPKIAEAVVFGIPHATKGAVPAAAIVLAKGAKATEAELLAWARDNIAGFKAPRAIAIVKADDIPRNANRKVMKDELRASLAKRFERAD